MGKVRYESPRRTSATGLAPHPMLTLAGMQYFGPTGILDRALVTFLSVVCAEKFCDTISVALFKILERDRVVSIIVHTHGACFFAYTADSRYYPVEINSADTTCARLNDFLLSIAAMGNTSPVLLQAIEYSLVSVCWLMIAFRSVWCLFALHLL